MNAFHYFIICALVAFGLACAGVWMLAGTGWALLAGSISMFSIAAFIRRGLSSE
ncbi:hypothetical protein [Pseudomonas auratipiscis]|uniref:Lipoprotein n=1 Tax=Pseudomonas auratipiscis TaxID=3115853 RepID=A0AB35WR66_9PSED|nr:MULTISPECIES: hypothetical protein [unclassified Pseudomonas]MEE1866927.1 hypothetical protein [Pseudomonas sp. 120P]MEE1960625.1 hypothetical protein [Pseudomonas sp. 119P]